MVVTPADGSYGQTVYAGSGTNVLNAFDRALEKKGLHVVKSPHLTSLTDIFAEAGGHDCQYVIVPKISHWEDRATEWSGKADRMTISVRTYTVEDQKLISNAEITAKSSWLTLGGDHPQDLLQEPVDEYVETLVP